MSRPSRVRALALFALLAAAGCQDYNFNPVGHCMIQPGTKRVPLSGVSRADILFVVDDSGSMAGEQAKLAANFQHFVTELDQTNVDRVANGEEPIDFHVAVTTTSVFYNAPAQSSCRSDCPSSAAGGPVCCVMSGSSPTTPLRAVKKCQNAADTSCGAAPMGCFDDCRQHLGEFVCCNATTKIAPATQEIACETVGQPCGDLRTHYLWDPSAPGCTPGLAQNGRPFPQGSFVGSGTNPRVIHFDKVLYDCPSPPCTVNEQGFTSAQLQTFFSQNVMVGTCGSGEEQGLEAAARAVKKSVDGDQLDVRDASGAIAANPVPAAWLPAAQESKLVLVFVGDEDDCSSEESASKGIVLTGPPGADACVADSALPENEQKQTRVSALLDRIATLAGDRPLGAAFIVSARAGASDVCVDDACTPAICCDTVCTGSASVCTTDVCGGQARGSRLLEAAGQLKGRGADVVAGSVCDPNFDDILIRIADIVKPPPGLLLPTAPATEDLVLVRIARPDGKTRKTCNGPAPAGLTAAQAKGTQQLGDGTYVDPPYDWWFTETRDQATEAQQATWTVSKFVFINHESGNCEASFNETYSADYLGRLPENGCFGATASEADASCADALGGTPGSWTCFSGVDANDRCIVPDGAGTPPVIGTCICGVRHVPPPVGSPAGTPGTGNCGNGCSPGEDGYCPFDPVAPPAP